MPLTKEQLLDIRGDCMADDIDIPPEAVSWVESEAIKFFESGGTCLPRNEGLEGAETHAFYDLQQRQFESTDADTMLDALSAALFKVTGDEEFKKEAPPQVCPYTTHCGTACCVDIAERSALIAGGGEACRELRARACLEIRGEAVQRRDVRRLERLMPSAEDVADCPRSEPCVWTGWMPGGLPVVDSAL